jgi:hypothetical protein
MNNDELDAILRKARTPEPTGEFRELFSRQIVSRLNPSRTRTIRNRQGWSPRWAWGLATAVCVLAAFAIGHWRGQLEMKTALENDVLLNAKFVQQTLAMFPNQVRTIEHDQHGLNLILSNNGNVPASSPIYVRICNGENCSSVVTFSGQEIQIAGQKLTVLSDAHGGIILEGDRFVWSSNGKNYVEENLKIEAKNLGTML